MMLWEYELILCALNDHTFDKGLYIGYSCVIMKYLFITIAQLIITVTVPCSFVAQEQNIKLTHWQPTMAGSRKNWGEPYKECLWMVYSVVNLHI